MQAAWFDLHEQEVRRYGSRAIGILLVLFSVLQAGGILHVPFLKRVELMTYDMRLDMTMPKSVFPGIVIVDIDEKSLAMEGRWPWRRDKMAKLVDQLFDRYQVAAAGFDIVFAEPDQNTGLEVLQSLDQGELSGVAKFHDALKRIAPKLDFDRTFADSMKGRAVVLGYYFSTEPGQSRTSGALPPPVFPTGSFPDLNTVFLKGRGYGGNLDILQSAASGGHFDPLPDVDGISRRVPMLIEYHGAYYDSLSLELARVVMGNAPITPIVKKSGGYSALEGLEVGGMNIPLDRNACSFVPYRGERGSFRYFSATDVLHGRVSPADLSGKIVLVGTTAPGLMDLRASPVGKVYPGVEIHANLLAGILEQNIMQNPEYSEAAELVTLLVCGTILTIFLPKMSPLKSLLFTLFISSMVLAGNLYAWKKGFVLPIASPFLLISSIFVVEILYSYFFESRAKRQMSGLFGQYVPPELVDEMSENPGMFSMKSENRQMTVLFADIRNFTKMSEGLDPEQLSSLINDYLTPMTTIIHSNHGTIDKYIGDAIMAFWGAPMQDPGHAENAVKAAIGMHRELARINVQFREKGWPELKIGVGINTGMMSVGNMGSQFRKAYTVMGDSVNLASRLEGLTKLYGVGILASEYTVQACPDISFLEVDRVRVKGKNEPVRIHTPEQDPDIAERFANALECYRRRDWEEAEKRFREIGQERARLAEVYLERIAGYRKEPPPEDWDGVLNLLTK